MDHEEALSHLRVIRKTMENSAKYSLLPSGAAIVGGCLVIAAAAVTYTVTGTLSLADIAGHPKATAWALIGVWAAAGLLALAIDIVWATVVAFRRGVNPFGRMARVAAYALGPSFVAGTVVGVGHLAGGSYNLLAAYSMIFYGLGLWAAALFSTRSPKLMGAAFLAAGLLTLEPLSEYSLVVAAVSFGGLHVAFGAYGLLRFGD